MKPPFHSRSTLIDAVEKAFADRAGQIAAIIVEPVVGNMGCVPPAHGFLEALRELTARHGSLLIFDEVMTGFALALGGAQQRLGSSPIWTTLGKIIGGGAADGGLRRPRGHHEKDRPSWGLVYQAGTLSGNPLAVAAGLAMLRYLIAHPEIYETLEARAAQLTAWTPPGVTVNRVGSMFTFFFSPNHRDGIGNRLEEVRHGFGSGSSFTSCWSAACTSHPRNSRPDLPRRPTVKKMIRSHSESRASEFFETDSKACRLVAAAARSSEYRSA